MYGLAIKLRAFFSAIIVSLAVCFSPAGNALVISQIYGGGGNSGSLFTNDFIEIFNNSPSVADLSGFSLQYASSSATTWHKTDLSGTLDPYHYYLIQEAGGSGGTTPLPAPDKIGAISLSSSNGNIALVSTQSLLPSANACLDTSILDLVGYGSAACYEGSAAIPGLSNTESAARLPVD
jgi:predicted extracellular nuclease